MWITKPFEKVRYNGVNLVDGYAVDINTGQTTIDFLYCCVFPGLMSKIFLGRFTEEPVFINYKPAEIERRIERDLQREGIELGNGVLAETQIGIGQDICDVFNLHRFKTRNYGYQTLAFGYCRSGENKYKDTEIEFDRQVLLRYEEDGLEESIELNDILRRLQDENDHLYCVDFIRDRGNLAIKTYSIENGTIIYPPKQSQILSEVNGIIKDKFRKYYQKLEYTDFYDVPFLELYEVIVENLE